jgi:hypothetical protein
MIVQAATHWEAPVSIMIQNFGHHSPSQRGSPEPWCPDTHAPLLIPPPPEILYITTPVQLDSPIYIPASPTILLHSPTPNLITDIIQTFLAEAEDNTTPPASPSTTPLPIYDSPTLQDPSPPAYEPQPGVHPGFLWDENLMNGVFKFPQFVLSNDQGEDIAPFYHINMNDKYPTVSTTAGCGCPTYTVPLCAQPHQYPRPLLMQKDEFLFHDGECFTPLVNKAIWMEGDITLRGEVICYQRAIAKVHSLLQQLVSLKRKFDDATWDMQNLGKRLAMANAYRHLEPHVLYGVQTSKDTVADISITCAFPNQEIALICLFLGTNLHENYMLECTGIWAIQKQQFWEN